MFSVLRQRVMKACRAGPPFLPAIHFVNAMALSLRVPHPCAFGKGGSWVLGLLLCDEKDLDLRVFAFDRNGFFRAIQAATVTADGAPHDYVRMPQVIAFCHKPGECGNGDRVAAGFI